MPWLPYHHDWKFAFEGEWGLRVHWFGRYAGYPGWSIPVSRLAADMVNFFFVERNSCWVVVNGRRLALNEGDLLVVSGADEFTYGHNPARPHVSLSASLALRQGGVANMLLQRRFERRRAWPRPQEYVAEFEKVLHAMSGGSPFRDLEIAGALLKWLGFVLDGLRPPLSSGALSGERGVVDKILAAESWASARLSGPVSLEEWAAATGLHPVYFGRVFKRETGLTPMAWLNQRRLQMAGQYLAGTRRSVAEIAEACGFASPFYFSRVFRRHFGLSPLEYRKARF